MCKVISIANQKGGVGKTAVAVNISACLAQKGYKVLLLDMDSQGSATASLGFREPDEMEDTLADVFNMLINDEDIDPDYGIRQCSDGFSVMPGNIDLAAVEAGLINVMNRERVLKDYISMVRLFYDFIIIDCCPSLGMLAINALAASDSVIIPVQPAYLPVKGLGQLFKTIYKVRKQINSNLEIEGVLMNMVDLRTNYAREIINRIHESYDMSMRVFNTWIPMSVKVGEATAEGISVLKHDPKGKASSAYISLAKEVLS